MFKRYIDFRCCTGQMLLENAEIYKSNIQELKL